PGENMQRCQLTRRCQLKDCARTGMNRITQSGNAAALAVVATGHSSPIEVAVRSLEKRALRRGSLRPISRSRAVISHREREAVQSAECGRLTHVFHPDGGIGCEYTRSAQKNPCKKADDVRHGARSIRCRPVRVNKNETTPLSAQKRCRLSHCAPRPRMDSRTIGAA